MRNRYNLALIVFLSCLLIIAFPTVAQDGYTPTIEWNQCPFSLPDGEVEGETIDCGYLTVPQDRANLGERTIELAFAVVYSPNASPSQPIMYLEGGPGGSALSGADLWTESPFRADHNIILLDQRGAGHSLPRLYCYEYEELDANADPDQFDNAMAQCRDRLVDEAIDLTDFNSIANATDVNDLRQALGVDTWTLFGVSYGTRLALTIMRDHPLGVHSVVLDSTYPQVVDAYEEQPVNVYRVLRQLFDDCAADAACNSAFPNLENRFFAMVDRYNDNPAQLPDDMGELWGDDITAMLVQHFYATPIIPYLPKLIDEFDRGIYDTYIGLDEGSIPPPEDTVIDFNDEGDLVLMFVDEFFYLTEDLGDDDYYDLFDEVAAFEYWEDFEGILSRYFAGEDASYLIDLLNQMGEEDLVRLETELFYEDVSDTDGMFNAFECNEEMPFNSYDEAAALAASIPSQIAESELIGFEQQESTCEIWQSGMADPIEDQAVTSNIPTLVLAGSYDPVTPPSWGQTAAATLENSYFYEFPNVGHGAVDGGECPESIIAAFLANPMVAPDGSCIGGMRVNFVTP